MKRIYKKKLRAEIAKEKKISYISHCEVTTSLSEKFLQLLFSSQEEDERAEEREATRAGQKYRASANSSGAAKASSGGEEEDGVRLKVALSRRFPPEEGLLGTDSYLHSSRCDGCPLRGLILFPSLLC